ncbi:MAG: TonB-dependent receptor plug domain-containing protein, partial [Pseudomonadales bacterium]|nr:TonB-dependent receptor plug domain-containing protein [Pseudomonadales bacterium]
MNKKILAVAIGSILLPATSLSIADDAGFTIEEIMVTARKREESLQDAPLAVTALSGQALDERDMTQISAIADIAPNVNFSFSGTSSGSGSAAVVYIRGVGQNDFTPVTDPGVGIYIDGVYLGRTLGSVLDIVDLERLEVLRGPQGTLFGRNSIGGAISLT